MEKRNELEMMYSYRNHKKQLKNGETNVIFDKETKLSVRYHTNLESVER